MIVRSNKISREDVVEAKARAHTHFLGTRSQEGWFVPIREFTPRNFKYGYEFFLGGSSKSQSAHDHSEKAATWIEWGIVIDYLFDIDPDAQIGMYKGREKFIEYTESEAERPGCEYNREDMPWLNKGVRT